MPNGIIILTKQPVNPLMASGENSFTKKKEFLFYIHIYLYIHIIWLKMTDIKKYNQIKIHKLYQKLGSYMNVNQQH